MLPTDSPVRIEKPTPTNIQLATPATRSTRIRKPSVEFAPTPSDAARIAAADVYAEAITPLPKIGQRPLRASGIPSDRPTIVASSGFNRIAAVPMAIAERV